MYSFDVKKLLARLFLLLVFIHLALYAVYHLSYVFILREYGAVFSYVDLYLGKAKSIILPAFIVTVGIITYVYIGLKKSLIYTFVLSLSTVFRSIPYYYIICIGYGFDTSESLLLTLPISLGLALVHFLFFLFVAFFLSRISNKQKNEAELCEELPNVSGFNPTTPLSKTLFFTCFIPFLVQFVKESIDVYSFFKEYGWNYEATELLLILFNYLFIFAALFASIAIANLTKKLLLKRVQQM